LAHVYSADFGGLFNPYIPIYFASDDYVPHLMGSIGCTDPTDLRHESKKSLEIHQHLSLDAVEKAYQEAVQGVSI
jgi:hypothetical protein